MAADKPAVRALTELNWESCTWSDQENPEWTAAAIDNVVNSQQYDGGYVGC